MSGLLHEIYRKWTHSFEEDTEDTIVYRPADFEFPHSRGRSGLEFKRDGTLISHGVGAADVPEPKQRQWEFDGPDIIQVSLKEGMQEPHVMNIIELSEDKLSFKKQ